MKKFLLLFGILILCQKLNLSAQSNSFSNMVFSGSTYDVFLIKVDSASIMNFEILENKNYLPYKDFIINGKVDSSSFLINACISDSFCKPLGYYFKDSTEVQPTNLNSGTGNFYLKPNGALIFLDNEVVICESSEIINYKNIQLGVQSGPMLLINGLPNPNFSVNSLNKNIRCGAGTFIAKSNESFLVFATSKSLVSFYEFSQFFSQKFNCQTALCLESSGCIIKLPFESKFDFNQDQIICNYIHYKFH